MMTNSNKTNKLIEFDGYEYELVYRDEVVGRYKDIGEARSYMYKLNDALRDSSIKNYIPRVYINYIKVSDND